MALVAVAFDVFELEDGAVDDADPFVEAGEDVSFIDIGVGDDGEVGGGLGVLFGGDVEDELGVGGDGGLETAEHGVVDWVGMDYNIGVGIYLN